jgi:thiol-disulfide isomerase/thioredoxin
MARGKTVVPLCLTVQAVLAAELVWAIVYYWQQPAIPPAGPEIITAVAMCVLLPMVVWYGLKPLFLHAKDYTLYQNAYKRLQYNPDTFHSQLVQQPKAADNWQQLGITVGNPDAENTIIKVCNPYCGPCARAHPQLEEVIQQNNNINLKIIFTAANNGHDQGAIVVKHLLAVAAEGNHLKTKKALDDWYLAPKKDYEAFATKYPMNAELKQQEAKLEAMSTWCKEAEIMYTPTIFVNGYRLPENYDVEELKHIL